MGKLTTHVLDTANGCPAAGVRVALYQGNKLISEGLTNRDGRMESPLAEGPSLVAGTYRLEFSVGAYFEGRGHADARRFLDIVPVVFVVVDASHSYHVPLLVSPWAY